MIWFYFWIAIMVVLMLMTAVVAFREKAARPKPAPSMAPDANIDASAGFNEADPVDSFGTDDGGFDAFEDTNFK